MKQIKIFVVEIIMGAAIMVAGLLIKSDYYSTLLSAMGFGLAFSSVVQIIRILYWNSPKHKAEYETKKQEEHINIIDERKQLLRAKAGFVTYQIMLCVLLALGVILAFLHVDVWTIATVYLLFILQCVIYVMASKILEKKM